LIPSPKYRAAWNEWRTGNRAALFPAGTYALPIYASVVCAPTVPSWALVPATLLVVATFAAVNAKVCAVHAEQRRESG